MPTRIARIAAGATLALAALVGAARADGFYIGGEAGWTSLEDHTFHTPLGSAKAVHSDGYNVGGRGGYEWGPWRFEGEVSYRENDVDHGVISGFRVNGIKGNKTSVALMANALYDFTFGWPITPHIGFGIGLADVGVGLKVPGIGKFVSDDDWAFAYQAIAGARYNITPQIAVDLDYRYFATTDVSLRDVFGRHHNASVESHNLVASLVYRFAPPPPVMVPPAAPVSGPPPSRKVFLVFFDWDRYNITAEGMRIIDQAADAYRAGGSVQLQVTGYTDRSGSPGYNQRLSERRATAVSNALAQRGVARNDMVVSGRGENDNRVPTAPGVREPQNRRVEIVFP
jgi:outer membrane protein OmpA-like peptidoglycan-associated protein